MDDFNEKIASLEKEVDTRAEFLISEIKKLCEELKLEIEKFKQDYHRFDFLE